LRRQLDDWLIWLIGLDDDLALGLRAPDSSDDLIQKLKHPFLCAVVRQLQTAIGLQDADHAQMRQVQTFSEQLCADNDIQLAVVELLVARIERLAGRVVGVEAGQPGFWKETLYLAGDELGANPLKGDVWLMTNWTAGRQVFAAPTEVTAQHMLIGVEHDADIQPEHPGEPARGPIAGLFASLAKLLATAIGIAQTRLELLTTELQEEVHRVAEIMVYAVIALLAAGVGLFLLALVIIFAFWDTHRIVASIAVTSAVFLIAIVAALVLLAKVRRKPPMLDGTLAELKKDRATLMRKRS